MGLFDFGKKNEAAAERRFEGKTLKVLGTGCKNCHTLYENAKEATAGSGAAVEYITDLETIMTYGVMSMPALVINDQVVSMGKVLKPADIQKLLNR